MMGSKKLSEIRRELKAAFSHEGGDPIQWLDERLRELAQEPEKDARSSEVLESLRRLIGSSGPAKKRGRRITGKSR
jgi:hypothetical protein